MLGLADRSKILSLFNQILKGNERKLFETSKIKLNVLKSEKIIGIN